MNSSRSIKACLTELLQSQVTGGRISTARGTDSGGELKTNHLMRAIILVTMLLGFGLTSLLAGQQTVKGRDYDQGREFEQMSSLLQLSAGSRVADIGAGGGTWTLKLAPRVGDSGHVFSTEVKAAQVDGIKSIVKARGLKNVTVVLGNQEDMGLPTNCCDAALLRLVYHAFKQPGKMRQSLASAIKPGGRLLIIDFRPEVEQLVKEMAEAEFELVEIIKQWRGQDSVYGVIFRKAAKERENSAADDLSSSY